MRALLLAALLAAVPAFAGAQDDWDGEEHEEQEGGGHRLAVTAWAGEGWDTAQSSRSGARLGGEASWAFDSTEVGVAGFAYRNLRNSTRAWTPVAMARLGESFRTRAGLEAIFSLGLGAARPDSWIFWYQIGLGVRLDLGRLFLAGELAFERYDQLRLLGGLGARF